MSLLQWSSPIIESPSTFCYREKNILYSFFYFVNISNPSLLASSRPVCLPKCAPHVVHYPVTSSGYYWQVADGHCSHFKVSTMSHLFLHTTHQATPIKIIRTHWIAAIKHNRFPFSSFSPPLLPLSSFSLPVALTSRPPGCYLCRPRILVFR